MSAYSQILYFSVAFQLIAIQSLWHTMPEFLALGGDTVGFPHTQHKTVFRIKPGDYILAYMTKASKWLAAMEVTADSRSLSLQPCFSPHP